MSTVEKGSYLEMVKGYDLAPHWILKSYPQATRNRREKSLSNKTRFPKNQGFGIRTINDCYCLRIVLLSLE